MYNNERKYSICINYQRQLPTNVCTGKKEKERNSLCAVSPVLF